MTVLTTVDAVIDALGGTSATALLTGRKPQHVSNWRAEKRIASNTYEIMKKHLRYRRLSAPSTLWGIKLPLPAAKKKKAKPDKNGKAMPSAAALRRSLAKLAK